MTLPWKRLMEKTKVPNVTDVKAAVGWSATAGIGALYFIQVRHDHEQNDAMRSEDMRGCV